MREVNDARKSVPMRAESTSGDRQESLVFSDNRIPGAVEKGRARSFTMAAATLLWLPHVVFAVSNNSVIISVACGLDCVSFRRGICATFAQKNTSSACFRAVSN
jgi:hypothetical protein